MICSTVTLQLSEETILWCYRK